MIGIRHHDQMLLYSFLFSEYDATEQLVNVGDAG